MNTVCASAVYRLLGHPLPKKVKHNLEHSR